MSLTPTVPDQQHFTRAASLQKALIERACMQAKLPGGNSRPPLVVAIAGGSASGKTTVAAALAAQLGPDQATLFSQDLFQLGNDFAGRKDSPYKWDDPQNFDVPACQRALEQLCAGRDVVVPNFDVVSNARLGTTEVVPQPVIIWEGIYAFLTPELRTAVTYSVFVDAPYLLRLLRRVSRFLERQAIDDISMPARHMLSFVLRADLDLVDTQRAVADAILDARPSPDDLQQEVTLFTARAQRHAARMASITRRDPIVVKRYAGLTFELYEAAFAIVDEAGRILYATNLEPELAAEAQIALQSVKQ